MRNDHLRDAVLAYSEKHPGADGIHPTSIPGLGVIRFDRKSALKHAYYEPSMIVVVQGAKDVLLGDTRFSYRAGQYLVLGVGLPVLASITDASPERPYLALGLTVDLQIIRQLMELLDGPPDPTVGASLGLSVGTLAAQQSGAITRMSALLDAPQALRALYASMLREVLYWTLTGPNGNDIRRLATPNSHTQRIAHAIGAMRAALAETVRIKRLAEIAHMSPSSFHYYFKATTSMSPLQYQKHLRLLEARQLMLVGGADATRAAYQVGYESISQFSREYARMFGAPPRRDICRVRTAVSEASRPTHPTGAARDEGLAVADR